jgi:hypothetical protein
MTTARSKRPVRKPAKKPPRPTPPDPAARTRPEVYRPAIERALIALAAAHGRATAAVEAALARIYIDSFHLGTSGRPIAITPVPNLPGASREERLRAALIQSRTDRADLEAALALRTLPEGAVRCNPGPWSFVKTALAETRGLLIGDGDAVPTRYWLDYLLAGRHVDFDLPDLDKSDYPEPAWPAFERGTVLGKRGYAVFGLLPRDDDSAQVFAVAPRFRVLGDDVVDFVERAVAHAIGARATRYR